jgi:hypothetical protein
VNAVAEIGGDDRLDLTILDGGGLEAAACGCYAADKETYSKILS